MRHAEVYRKGQDRKEKIPDPILVAPYDMHRYISTLSNVKPTNPQEITLSIRRQYGVFVLEPSTSLK